MYQGIPLAYMYCNPYAMYPNPLLVPYLTNLSLSTRQPVNNNQSVISPFQFGLNNPYSAIRTKDSVIVLFNDPNCIDEETTYTFKADGSASSVSHAWGAKKEYPAGTFSKMMKNLPSGDISSEIAEQMVNEFHKRGKKGLFF